MRVNKIQVFLCQSNPLSPDNFKILKERIDQMYQVNINLDNLLAIQYINTMTKDGGYILRWTGYPIGKKVHDDYYVFSHLKFTVLVHNVQHNPKLLKDLTTYSKYPSPIKCKPDDKLSMLAKEGQPLIVSYEVSFVESDIRTIRRDLARYEELDKEAQAQLKGEFSG
ncbi:hypothetical protein ACH5RR_040018 [Cinchona calisaya]|uniref:Transmembrane 9 superfamily member n=1 Tax=Cinchona calisaya TaxID=153742 RepID=A0ABD2Y409_9GENT